METKAALDEYEEMKKNPGNYKRYESFDEVLDEVFADANALANEQKLKFLFRTGTHSDLF